MCHCTNTYVSVYGKTYKYVTVCRLLILGYEGYEYVAFLDFFPEITARRQTNYKNWVYDIDMYLHHTYFQCLDKKFTSGARVETIIKRINGTMWGQFKAVSHQAFIPQCFLWSFFPIFIQVVHSFSIWEHHWCICFSCFVMFSLKSPYLQLEMLYLC